MIWTFSIAADITTPNPPEGYVRAETEAEAFALIGHPDTNLYRLCDDVEWPGGELDSSSLWWDRR
ncbi:putative transaminase [Rhodovulum sulfidophilum]|uniref:Putative transaminase n=1 Tax=Rhodovulum sulfidophilum TaxID=35806 RepID=A0A0D6B0X9_RHOSU|nr:putative transaminase [Rhodovulum sulfidophilum]BAQ70423.1 putative transaminase [Rhodovulum sulfidophilum]